MPKGLLRPPYGVLAMTLVLSGMAAWFYRVNFGDIDAKCVENPEKVQNC